MVSPADAEDKAARAAARELGVVLDQAAKRGQALGPDDFHRETERAWRAYGAEMPPEHRAKPVEAWVCDRCRNFVVAK